MIFDSCGTFSIERRRGEEGVVRFVQYMALIAPLDAVKKNLGCIFVR